LYIVWENFATAGVGQIYADRSLDGGVTWGPDVLVYTGQLNIAFDPASPPNPFNGQRRYQIPAQPDRDIGMALSLAVDRSSGPHRGRLYLTFTDQADGDANPFTNHDNVDVFMLASDLGGTAGTWNA